MFLEVKNISFSFARAAKTVDEDMVEGKELTIKDISFSLREGETIAIVGASGSGKSTLLRLISGILPDNGAQHFYGAITVDDRPPTDYVKGGRLSFMFQEPALLPHLPVRENIALPLLFGHRSEQEGAIIQKVNFLIETIGLRPYEHYLPRELSGGMRTRVALARSFVTDPQLLLLDEPFSSLDIAWKDALYHELAHLKKSFRTAMILVTHDITEALRLADKVICLGMHGEILLQEQGTSTPDIHSRLENAIIQDHKLRNLR